MKFAKNFHMKKIYLHQIILIILFCFSHTKAQISILGEMTHEKNAMPGEVYQGTLTIQNSGDKIESMRIYQTDFSFQSDGTNNYDEPGTLPRSNATWISYSPKQASIQPHETANINYYITVPEDNELIGTYWSMMMVESIPEIPTEEPTGDLAIRVVMRYGIQMITNIGDTGTRKLKFIKPELIKEGDYKFFRIDIENIGERWLRPKVWVELYTIEGVSCGTYNGTQSRIYPNTSTRFKIDISDVKSGIYKALFVADCGEENLFGANYTLEIGE